MGAKTGYADVILRCMGLRPGQGSADGTRYLWCEPDAGVRLLLHAYRDRAVSLAAAEIIRGWAGEDPRALWERLRAEGPARCPPVDPREVARLAFLWRGSFHQKGPRAGIGKPEGQAPSASYGGFPPRLYELEKTIPALPTLPATITTDARQVDPAEVARFLYGTAASYGGPKGSLWDTFLHPETGGRYGAARADVADKTAALPTVEAAIATDARQVDPAEVARWSLVSGWAAHGKDAGSYGGPGRCGDKTCALTIEGAARRYSDAPTLPATITTDARQVDPREVARYARILTANRLVNPDPETWQNTGRGGYRHGGADFCTPAADLAARFADAVEVPGAAVVDDARAVDPREVARWSLLVVRSFGQKGPRFGYAPMTGDEKCIMRRWRPDQPAQELQDTPTIPATITDDARAVDPPQLPPGVVAYIDPPYVNTTGYAHAFPRSEWLPVVRRWVEAGALVVVSEAEPIAELVAEGWHAVEITGERKGQKRTFSKQQREWLTISRAPAWKPSEQMGLFDGRS